ncbi:hypothetical protein OG422_19455 [Streptomyces sp. NBC_01525]|uniref:Secreted protein n=1 Tax=Streptomyces benahoarensis TaxID=2595054 RepID=A0A553YGV8_9ACTN|nr:hypothetical protein [Streptomyces benahoarensis]TSB19324.1 hypothetical protein FNJ62_22635 [Streptomyces benahoarensis]TSB28293.1 hypothetical protein FNZ23_26600 [Streptomyces benahoarensis]
MRHPVRRSLAVAAAAVGLVAFGATAAQADSDWVPSDRTDLGVFHALTAADGGRVILPPSDDCDPAPGEICRVDPEDPTGYFVTRQASLRSGEEGKLIPRVPAADGDTGRVICDQNGDCWTDRIDPTVPSIPGQPRG